MTGHAKWLKERCCTDLSLSCLVGAAITRFAGDLSCFLWSHLVTHITYDRIISWEISVNWCIHVTSPVAWGSTLRHFHSRLPGETVHHPLLRWTVQLAGWRHLQGCNALIPQIAWHSAFQTGAGMGHTKKWVGWWPPFNQAVTAGFVVNKKNCPSPMQEVSHPPPHTQNRIHLNLANKLFSYQTVPGIQQIVGYFASVACPGVGDRVKENGTPICKIFSESTIGVNDDR